jgi:hypothetical protein
MERLEFYAINCGNPKKVKVEIKPFNNEAIKGIPKMQKILQTYCPRISKEVEFDLEINRGVAVSLTCTQVYCRFNKLYKGNAV